MESTDLPNNGVNGTGSQCEGPSPGRCPMEEQRGPGRHPATAQRSKEENGVNMITG